MNDLRFKGFIHADACQHGMNTASPALELTPKMVFPSGQDSSSTFFGESDPLKISSSVHRHARWWDLKDGCCSRRWDSSSIENRKQCVAGPMTVIDKCGQATKGVWWMSWHREAMKDVVACDKLREAGKQALIRRFPNEETQLG